jgi:hypothetical protein
MRIRCRDHQTPLRRQARNPLAGPLWKGQTGHEPRSFPQPDRRPAVAESPMVRRPLIAEAVKIDSSTTTSLHPLKQHPTPVLQQQYGCCLQSRPGNRQAHRVPAMYIEMMSRGFLARLHGVVGALIRSHPQQAQTNHMAEAAVDSTAPGATTAGCSA